MFPISVVEIIPWLFIIYFVFLSVSVKVDKVPYTLQFCDTAGQASLFKYFHFVFISEINIIFQVVIY